MESHIAVAPNKRSRTAYDIDVDEDSGFDHTKRPVPGLGSPSVDEFCISPPNVTEKTVKPLKPVSDTLHKGPSKYWGVSWNAKNQKWIVQIFVKDKQYYLGSFVKEEDAAKKYDEHSIKLCNGRRLNFPAEGGGPTVRGKKAQRTATTFGTDTMPMAPGPFPMNVGMQTNLQASYSTNTSSFYAPTRISPANTLTFPMPMPLPTPIPPPPIPPPHSFGTVDSSISFPTFDYTSLSTSYCAQSSLHATEVPAVAYQSLESQENFQDTYQHLHVPIPTANDQFQLDRDPLKDRQVSSIP